MPLLTSLGERLGFEHYRQLKRILPWPVLGLSVHLTWFTLFALLVKHLFRSQKTVWPQLILVGVIKGINMSKNPNELDYFNATLSYFQPGQIFSQHLSSQTIIMNYFCFISCIVVYISLMEQACFVRILNYKCSKINMWHLSDHSALEDWGERQLSHFHMAVSTHFETRAAWVFSLSPSTVASPAVCVHALFVIVLWTRWFLFFNPPPHPPRTARRTRSKQPRIKTACARSAAVGLSAVQR